MMAFALNATIAQATWLVATEGPDTAVLVEPLGFWVLSILFILAAVYVAYNVGRRIGRRRTRALILEQKQEISRQGQRLQDLLDASERARSSVESALGGSEERAAKLSRMFELRGDFFANISHEFRTPLTLVIDPLETALKGGYGPLDPLLEPRLRTAHRNARQILRLINQLLDLAKMDAGKMSLRVSEQDLIPLIQGVVARFDSEADRRRVSMIFSSDAETPALYVDTEKLERVIGNLLSNALQATPSGGKILVTLRRATESDGEVAEIAVRDTGIGIAPERQALVFDRFYHVGRPSTGDYVGTGLGLALAREFVELHRGTISVESVPGFGSTFTIRLRLGRDQFNDAEVTLDESEHVPEVQFPEELTHDPVEEAKPSALTAQQADKEKSRALVLIVDDNADVRQLIRDHLSSIYRIAEATNGLEGLSRARKLHPDLIISDVIMPGMEGIAFCRLVKQDKDLLHIPIILLTALASDEDRLEGIQVGVDSYITRPFRAEELLASVEHLIKSRRALRERYSQEVVLKPYGATIPSSERPFFEQVLEAIDLHLEDSRFTVGQLAREIGLSETQLKRKLRALLDEAPVELIRKIRIERAAELLRRRAGNVSDVAFATGFSNLSYFAKCFRERWGVTPSQFLAGAHTESDGEASQNAGPPQ